MTVLKWIGGALLAVVVFLIVWGSLIEPRFLLDIQSHEAEVPNLPPAWEGHTVALLADLQVGMWMDNTGMVKEAVEEALEANSALVLIAGDFVYKPDSAVVQKAVALLRPLLEAKVPVVAVLGNHDYSMMKEKSRGREAMARYLTSELAAAGVHVLENEAFSVARPGSRETLYVAGIGSVWAKRSRPAAALADVPDGAPRVVLMHNPVAYRELPADAAPLALAAHTHGGQIRIPLTPSASWLSIARPREVIADGWAAKSVGAAGNRLYVNRGIGFSLVPLRIFCRPELTLFTLHGTGDTMPERGPASPAPSAQVQPPDPDSFEVLRTYDDLGVQVVWRREQRFRYGLADATGRLFVEPQFESVAREDSSVYARIRRSFSGDEAGLIDLTTGEILLEPVYAWAQPFVEGLAAVKIGERWGYLGEDKAFAIDPQFDGASDFEGGEALVLDRDTLQVIGRDGRAIRTLLSDSLRFAQAEAGSLRLLMPSDAFEKCRTRGWVLACYANEAFGPATLDRFVRINPEKEEGFSVMQVRTHAQDVLLKGEGVL